MYPLKKLLFGLISIRFWRKINLEISNEIENLLQIYFFDIFTKCKTYIKRNISENEWKIYWCKRWIMPNSKSIPLI